MTLDLDTLARLVVEYANAHGLTVSAEANELWDACEAVLGKEISEPQFRGPLGGKK